MSRQSDTHPSVAGKIKSCCQHLRDYIRVCVRVLVMLHFQDGSAVLYTIEGGYRFGLELILNAEQYDTSYLIVIQLASR